MAEYTLYPSQSEGMLDDDELPSVHTTGESEDASLDEAFENGACPWCDRDGFSRPEMHARQAHPGQWEAYDA